MNHFRVCNAYFVLLILVVFSSCSKSGDSTPTSSTVSVTCIANGTSYSFSSAYIKVHSGTSEVALTGNDNKGNSIYHVINYSGNTTSLVTGSFPNKGGEDLIGGVDYANGGASSSTFIITSIHSGEADGTFSAVLIDVATGTKVLKVTNGVFKNVPIL